MSKQQQKFPKTLGALKKAGYTSKTIKHELRDNLLAAFRNRENPFAGIVGYERTVLPDLQRAILAGHNINFLGLRGQAKTRMARAMVNLLDPYIPVVAGSVLNEDPLNPLLSTTRDLLEEEGDDTPIEWLSRAERYTEKLATPDVSVADLIGDIDPIKAAHLKLSFSDERVIHFGLIPRSNRGLFVINELPDLQARIQVSLFNILQEGDIQIRGFKIRLPLDMQFIFTANPEDYTNRGSIVTPLKDRIESQILTHYPKSIDDSMQITQQEARILPEQKQRIQDVFFVRELVEQISFEGRKSEYVDAKSGVSARLTISALEMLYSAAERRTLLNGDPKTSLRISDLLGVIPAINGKVELVYEGEQEGQQNVALHLMNKAIRSNFAKYFPDPERIRRKKEANPYQPIVEWFGKGNELDLGHELSEMEYQKRLSQIPGLSQLVQTYQPGATDVERYVLMEFVLFGLSEYSLISKHILDQELVFKDLLNAMFSGEDEA